VTGAIPTLDPYGNQVFIIGNGGRNWANQHSYSAKGEYSFTDATVLNVEYIRQDFAYGYNMYNSYLKDASGATVDTGTFLANYAGTLQPISILPSSFLQDDGNQHSHFISASLIHKFRSDQTLRIDGSYFDTPNNNYRTPGFFSDAGSGPGTYSNTIARSLHGNVQYNQTFHRQTITVGSEARHDFASNPSYALSNWTLPDTLGAQTSAAIGHSVNAAVYVQDEVSLTERLHLVAGGRYEYWQTYNGQTNGYSPDAPLTYYPNRSVNSFNGKIGGTYGLPGGWTMRASIGTAFRNPTIYELYTTYSLFGMTFGANPYLSPERDRSFEFGVHKRLGSRAEFDADFYQNNISNLIYLEADLALDPTGNFLTNVNAAQGRTRGVEASLRTQLLSWLMFRTNYTYTDAIITSNPDEPDSVGKLVPNIPVNMYNAQLLAQYKKWTGSLTGRYAGATYSTDNNSDVIKGVPEAYDAFFLLNANLGYQITKHVQVFATGDNLLDRRYYIFYLAPGRQVFGGVRLKF
jgi:iron complex outermembrane recepter protein